jgi:hypothetical protein
MLRRVFLPRALVLSCLLISACDRGKPPAAPPSETPPATQPKAPHDRSIAFHDLDKQGKMDRMTEVVMPDMGPVFKAFDGARYAAFDCATCHVNHVHHPKDGLPKLVFSNGGYEKLVAEQPEMMKFMGEQVLPAMVKAMAETPFDPATGQGFGCNGCHTIE